MSELDPLSNKTAQAVAEEWLETELAAEVPAEPPAKPEISEGEMTAQRDTLFAEGSKFKPVSRDQIVGIDDVLDEIDEIIHWLQYSHSYMLHGARLEPGIILAGQPGTGKTSTARYIATEAKATFINVRDFPHKGNLFADSDIRDLFTRARRHYSETNKPVILFWDEFEGVAVERGENNTTPDQAAVVSQLTSELEGALGKNEGLLLIGCTNYLNHIDRALRRSGRLGVHFEFTAPDRQGKRLILEHYLNTFSASKIDTETLSHFFDKNATAADIEEACIEAWRNAVRRSIHHGGDPHLVQQDLIKIFIKRLVGPPTTYKVPQEERIRIAIHEIGHAVVAMAYGVKVRLITVQPGKKSLGRTMLDELTEYIATKEEILNSIRCGAGGISAERAAGLPEMVGCTGDIVKINQQVAGLVDKMGYGKSTGLFNASEYVRTPEAGYGQPSPSISQQAINRSDLECKKLVDQIERDANDVMEGVGHEALWEIAWILNSRVTLTGAEFEQIFHEVTGCEPVAYRPGAASLIESAA